MASLGVWEVVEGNGRVLSSSWIWEAVIWISLAWLSSSV